MFQFLKVTGESLSPSFQEGDYVLVAKLPFLLRPLHCGDVIVIHHPIYGTLIKRIERLSPDGSEIHVQGTHPDSNDSRRFGPIRRADAVGKVIWHIRRNHE